ncbi:MAG: hypothetical protein TYPL_1600 [Candidatus Tyloplasma litorale]|nr:MAG: hypothetical protein TYPL_1600 [Mycoplasmatales bacterium]
MKGLLIQEFKTLFRSPSSISILAIPLVLIIGLGYLLPSGWIVPSSITIGIVAAVLLYFGGSIEEIKRTSFMKSISLTRLNKFSFLSTKILFSIFISMIAVLWVLFFSWFFTDVVDFLADDFNNITEGTDIEYVGKIPMKINWGNVQWIKMLYAGAITIIISISIAFIFVTFSKSSLSFYLMSFGYLLAMILFGGVVMPSFLVTNDWFSYFYYLIPNFYTNNIMAEAFGGSLGVTANNLANNLETLLANPFLQDASSGTISSVSTFLSGWDWTQSSLDSIYGSIDFNNLSDADGAYVKHTYDWLSQLSDGQYLEVFSSIDNSLQSLIPLLSNPIAGQLSNLDYDTWFSILRNLGVGVINAGTVAGILSAIPQEQFNSILSPILESFSPTISDFAIKQLIIIGQTNSSLSNWIIQLGNTVNDMFNTSSAIDYIIPWVEVVIFLGISTIFFKWS